MSTLLVTAHFPQLTNMALTLCALIIACSGVHCGLKYQHWPMMHKLCLIQKCCQWRKLPIQIRQKECSKIGDTNIDVHSYRRAHRRASCSAGVICMGCGAVTCNRQLSIYSQFLGTPEYLEFIQLSHRSIRSVLLWL